MCVSYSILVVKRGCRDQGPKVKGRYKYDGEGCEEILQPSGVTSFGQVLCMCKTELCNGVTERVPGAYHTEVRYIALILYYFYASALF